MMKFRFIFVDKYRMIARFILRVDECWGFLGLVITGIIIGFPFITAIFLEEDMRIVNSTFARIYVLVWITIALLFFVPFCVFLFSLVHERMFMALGLYKLFGKENFSNRSALIQWSGYKR